MMRSDITDRPIESTAETGFDRIARDQTSGSPTITQPAESALTQPDHRHIPEAQSWRAHRSPARWWPPRCARQPSVLMFVNNNIVIARPDGLAHTHTHTHANTCAHTREHTRSSSNTQSNWRRGSFGKLDRGFAQWPLAFVGVKHSRKFSLARLRGDVVWRLPRLFTQARHSVEWDRERERQTNRERERELLCVWGAEILSGASEWAWRLWARIYTHTALSGWYCRGYFGRCTRSHYVDSA